MKNSSNKLKISLIAASFVMSGVSLSAFAFDSTEKLTCPAIGGNGSNKSVSSDSQSGEKEKSQSTVSTPDSNTKK